MVALTSILDTLSELAWPEAEQAGASHGVKLGAVIVRVHNRGGPPGQRRHDQQVRQPHH